MEIRCPKCTQRLRYPDRLRNPQLRCRTCGSTFRAAEAAPVEEFATAEVVAEAPRPRAPYIPPEPVAPIEPAIPTFGGPSASAARGLGTIAVVLLVIAVKAGPRLAREFFQERKPPAAPVAPAVVPFDQPADLDKMLQEARDRAMRDAAARQLETPPPVPADPPVE